MTGKWRADFHSPSLSPCWCVLSTGWGRARDTGTTTVGPGLGGMPATSGVTSVDSNMMDVRQLGGWHEKVGVTLLKSTCVVQMKESLVEEIAVEQSSGRVLVNWAETVT